ncbi:MAG: AIPR family protein [Patescibacteria group bacterium]|nr:AIPR family protein [Patescibacteria group bacterium]
MPNYQDFSLIKKEVEFVKKRNKLDTSSQAFIFGILEKLYPEIDPDENITDGGRDYSIDAYYIDEEREEINIFQFKYTEKFENAKNKEAFHDEDLSDLVYKLKKLWDKDRNLLKLGNAKVVEAIRNIWNAFDRGFVNTNIWLISNHYSSIRDINKIRDLRKKLEEEFRASSFLCSLDDLVKLLLQKEFKPVDIQLQLKGRNYFDDTTGEIRALIGEINALNLIKSLLDDDNKLREEVFNENIRVYLRQSTKINKQIYFSIEYTEENPNFFFYNNGITAICDSYTHPNTDSPLVNLKNFQIVNGGQTVHSLYEAYKNGLTENLKNIYLLLRIYEVKKREIGQTIARYTNTQNPVRTRDIMSNDPIQVKLQQELMTMGWYYERKKYEFRDVQIDDARKIDAEKTGQVILAFYLEKPGSAKNKKQEIFGSFYNEIFDENKINAEYVLLPYLLYKDIEKEIKQFTQKTKRLKRENKLKELEKILSRDEFLLYAHYYLLLGLKFFAQKEEIDLLINNRRAILKNYKKIKKVIQGIVREKKEKDPKFSLSYLFKSDDLVGELKDKISK